MKHVCIGLLALAGCQVSKEVDPVNDAAAHQPAQPLAQGTDCIAPLVFNSRSYTLVLGREVRFVEPGKSLGNGRYALCADGGGEAVGDSREVYALSGVPVEQAVVVGRSDQGAVLMNLQAASGGWDVDLLALLRKWKVDVPQS